MHVEIPKFKNNIDYTKIQMVSCFGNKAKMNQHL